MEALMRDGLKVGQEIGQGIGGRKIPCLAGPGHGQALDLIRCHPDFLQNSLHFPANPCIRPASSFLNSN
jgi:hypothetical protein